MTWRYHELNRHDDGSPKSMDRPSSRGIHIDGPLSADELKAIVAELIDEIERLAGRDS